MTDQSDDQNTPACNSTQSDLDTFRMSLKYSWEVDALDDYADAGWTASDLHQCIRLVDQLPNRAKKPPHQALFSNSPDSVVVRLLHLAIRTGLLSDANVMESAT